MLSERLKELRNKKGVLQKDVANYLGITSSAYGFYEQSKRQPDPETLQKLADYFNVTVDYLLGGSNKPTIDFSSIKREITPEDIPDEYAKQVAGVIRRSSTIMTDDEQALLLDMIKGFVASVENRKKAQHDSERGNGKENSEDIKKKPSN